MRGGLSLLNYSWCFYLMLYWEIRNTHWLIMGIPINKVNKPVFFYVFLGMAGKKSRFSTWFFGHVWHGNDEMRLYGHVSKGKCHGFFGWKACWLRGFRGTLASKPFWWLGPDNGSYDTEQVLEQVHDRIFMGYNSELLGVCSWDVTMCSQLKWGHGVTMLMRRYDFSPLFWRDKVMWIQNCQATTAVSWSGPSVLCLLAIQDLWTVQQNPCFLDMAHPVQTEIRKKPEWKLNPCLFSWWWWFTALLFLFATHAFLWFPIWIADATELDPRQWLSKHGPFEGCKDPTCSKAALLVGGWSIFSLRALFHGLSDDPH